MKTYYEKNFSGGVLNSNAGTLLQNSTGLISGRANPTHHQKHMQDLYVPLQLNKHQNNNT